MTTELDTLTFAFRGLSDEENDDGTVVLPADEVVDDEDEDADETGGVEEKDGEEEEDADDGIES